MSRKNQRMAWVHEDFIRKLEEIRAKKILNGDYVRSIGDLTKEIAHCDSFMSIEDEILKKKGRMTQLNAKIKIDGLLD